ncbi:MAG TPA: hypothetical protein VG817_06700 [Gemmatimonadales bacterium]|nr:hypothetical protein [Gemmatimonadales bacterium]
MAPKRSTLRNLPKKGVNGKKADAVKGGMRKEVKDKLATNHNQTVL